MERCKIFAVLCEISRDDGESGAGVYRCQRCDGLFTLMTCALHAHCQEMMRQSFLLPLLLGSGA